MIYADGTDPGDDTKAERERVARLMAAQMTPTRRRHLLPIWVLVAAVGIPTLVICAIKL